MTMAYVNNSMKLNLIKLFGFSIVMKLELNELKQIITENSNKIKTNNYLDSCVPKQLICAIHTVSAKI